MQILEPVLLATELGCLLVSLRSAPPDRLARALLAITWAVLAAHAILEVPRWPMIPAYALVVLLTLASRWPKKKGRLVRVALGALGTVLIGTAALLAVELPVVDLPAPDGSHVVGITSLTLVDEWRAETLAPEPGVTRALFVDVWYPAARPSAGAARPASLWPELYAGEWDRVRFFTDYLRAVDTHSYRDLPVDGGGPFPVLLFNHGLQMFTAQNTLLMEHLASHGYVVFSIGHPYESLRVNLPGRGAVIPEFIASREGFAEAMRWVEEANRHILVAVSAARAEKDPERSAQIMLEAVEDSPELNRRVEVWVEDTRFVLDRVLDDPGAVPSLRPALDATRVGAIGMSLGGAVATEFFKADSRCRAAVNVDGLQYGMRPRQPVEVPLLMVASDDGAGLNGFVRATTRAEYVDCHLEGTRHPDFTDLPLVWPWLGRVGQLGRVPPERVRVFLEATALDFVDRHVVGRPGPTTVPEGCSRAGA